MQSSESTPKRRRRLRWLLITAGLGLFWSIAVLYPNPLMLTNAIANTADMKIDPEAVRHWADELPDDPAYIESQVEGPLVRYEVPWETYGVPWYFPTTREVVQHGAGDCQARLVVFASILEAKGIPYEIRASIDHIWVEYEGKKANRIENAAIAVVEDGRIQLPQQWDWRDTWRVEKHYYWDTAPLLQRILLVTGLVLILFRGRIMNFVRRQMAQYGNAHASLTDGMIERVRIWEAEGRVDRADSVELQSQLESRRFERVMPHLAAHAAMGLTIPFPLAGFVRAGWTSWMLLSTLARWAVGRVDRETWRETWDIHHPLVVLIGGMPVIGSAAYLVVTPLRSNLLAWRAVSDAMLSQIPWQLHDRVGTRRLIEPSRDSSVAG